MIAQVEPIVFTVEEAAKLAHCDAYSLLSQAVDKGVQIYTYLPENSMAVSVDRRYVRGEEMRWSTNKNSTGLAFPMSVPCMTGLRLDDSDCREIVRQKKFSRTFFEWGVVITGKDLPIETHASASLFSICIPTRTEDATVATDTATDWDLGPTEPLIPPFHGPLRPYEVPQRCFGVYPADLGELQEFEPEWMPRPRDVVLHPKNLFLLKEGMDLLGLLPASMGRSQRNAAAASVGAVAADEVTGLETPLCEFKDGEEAIVVPASSVETTDEKIVLSRNVQFSEIDIKDYWPYWLKGFIQVASREWAGWRKADGVTQTKEDREKFAQALLRFNHDHKGRELEPVEAKRCVTMLSPQWAWHWGSKEERPLSPPSPVSAELLEMIASAEAIKVFSDQTGKRVTKKKIGELLREGRLHNFSARQAKIVIDLLYDAPKKPVKNEAEKKNKKQRVR